MENLGRTRHQACSSIPLSINRGGGKYIYIYIERERERERISKTLRKEEFFKLDPPKKKFIKRYQKIKNWQEILAIQN